MLTQVDKIPQALRVSDSAAAGNDDARNAEEQALQALEARLNLTVFCEQHMHNHDGAQDCYFCQRARWSAFDEAREQQAQALAHERDKHERIQQLMAQSGIPRCYQGATFETYHAESLEQARAKSTAERFVSKYHHHIAQHGKALLLTGTTGTGKTLLASIIAQALIKQDVRVIYTSAHRLLLRLREAQHFSSQKSVLQVIDEYAQVPLLIVDEVGMQFDTDSARRDFFEIINSRYENLLPLVLISNLSGEALTPFLSDRVISRLHERAVHVCCDWEDYRTRPAAGVGL